MVIIYHFIFKPEEVAEVEVSITQCDSGVTFPKEIPRCADQAPHLQERFVKRNYI